MGIGKIVRVVLDEGLTAGERRVCSAAADRWRGKRGTEKRRGSAKDRRERDQVRGKSADKRSTRGDNEDDDNDDDDDDEGDVDDVDDVVDVDDVDDIDDNKWDDQWDHKRATCDVDQSAQVV